MKKGMATSQKNIAHAVKDFITALGHPAKGVFKNTPQRVASLWTEHLLWGESHPMDTLFKKLTPTQGTTPVAVVNIGIYMVCPHHLTVATGYAHVAYVPNGFLCGLGSLSQLAKACTARLVLQEDATSLMVDTLCTYVKPKAAVVCIEAQHPCHFITHPRSHQAKSITWGEQGSTSFCRTLKQHIQNTRT
jgi:GTP cyclohydrolase I